MPVLRVLQVWKLLQLLILLTHIFSLQRFHGHHELVIATLVVVIDMHAVSLWLVNLQHVQVFISGDSCKLLLALRLLLGLILEAADTWIDELGACLAVLHVMPFRGFFVRVV